MTIVIESDFPMPTARTRSEAYPFGDMEVGQSFATTAKPGSAGSLVTNANKKHTPKRYAYRRSPSGDGGRVWRTV